MSGPDLGLRKFAAFAAFLEFVVLVCPAVAFALAFACVAHGRARDDAVFDISPCIIEAAVAMGANGGGAGLRSSSTNGSARRGIDASTGGSVHERVERGDDAASAVRSHELVLDAAPWSCCGSGCMPEGSVCCSPDHYCPSGTACCGSGCCGTGTHCCGEDKCCPDI